MRFDLGALRTASTTLFAAALVVLIPVGCGGPERAPRQPISGVDRPVEPESESSGGGTSMTPREETPSPSATTPTGPGTPTETTPPSEPPPLPARATPANDLQSFIAAVAAELRKDNGFAAVFWPLSPRPLDQAGVASPRGKYVNRMGERLADEIASGLQAEGAKTLAGAELVNDLLAANRSLASYCDLTDVFWLAERVGAPYAIYGTAQVVSYEALRGDRVLELRLWAKHLPTNRTIALLSRDYREGREAQQYYKEYVLPSQVPVCSDAAPAKPSLESELEITSRVVARRVAAKAGAAMQGKVAYFEPLAFPASRKAALDLVTLQDAFLRAFSAAGSDLAKGPAKLGNQSFATFGEALDEIGKRRRAYEASEVGAKSRELSANIENVLSQAGMEFVSGLEDGDMDALLRRVRAEAFRGRAEDAIDAQSLAYLQASGSAYLVRPSLLPSLEAWRLRVAVFDLNTGRKIADEAEALPASLSADLQNALR
ncbi:MAG: hypothetical protein JNM84_13820 [Planctomycetes bacterium]|nr:hypothetical protein [Planctomycetota bacterium]